MAATDSECRWCGTYFPDTPPGKPAPEHDRPNGTPCPAKGQKTGAAG
ncbi:hypothetical protein ACFOY2_46140 [Nonomuraea purpurea]|uniref:Rubredoxin n=1 Tax=Nonomuraea purpurea TaxID=1849276 RepID=A0ABV8GNZ4_9ACTN